MNSILELLFITNLAFIFTHELDAIRRHEWRFFFSSTPLSDQAAYRLFTALHIPLFIFIIWNLQSFWFQAGFDIFLIIHAGLHWVLRNHPHVKFNNWFSQLWINGGALFGAIHLILLQ